MINEFIKSISCLFGVSKMSATGKLALAVIFGAASRFLLSGKYTVRAFLISIGGLMLTGAIVNMSVTNIPFLINTDEENRIAFSVIVAYVTPSLFSRLEKSRVTITAGNIKIESDTKHDTD